MIPQKVTPLKKGSYAILSAFLLMYYYLFKAINLLTLPDVPNYL
jgi:hypothetical protein